MESMPDQESGVKYTIVDGNQSVSLTLCEAVNEDTKALCEQICDNFKITIATESGKCFASGKLRDIINLQYTVNIYASHKMGMQPLPSIKSPRHHSMIAPQQQQSKIPHAKTTMATVPVSKSQTTANMISQAVQRDETSSARSSVVDLPKKRKTSSKLPIVVSSPGETQYSVKDQINTDESGNHVVRQQNELGTGSTAAAGPSPKRTPHKRVRKLAEPRESLSMTFQSDCGQRVHVFKGDIRRLKVDAILNPTDWGLTHKEGIAKLIAAAAGPGFRAECRQLFTKDGGPSKTHIVCTKGHSLPCVCVMHVEAEDMAWNFKATDQMIEALSNADRLDMRSIAVPPLRIHSNTREDVDICELMCRAVWQFCSRKSKLTDILLVDPGDDIPRTLVSILRPACSVNHMTVLDSLGYHHFLVQERGKGKQKERPDDCPICADVITDRKSLGCGHVYCKDCIETWFATKPTCPLCGTVFGVVKGDQPDGRMTVRTLRDNLPGFTPAIGSIEITYSFPAGYQKPHHPNPGKPYQGITRIAYLPDNAEGKVVAKLLKKAFEAKVTFTIGHSVITGREGQITWNDIHHKTSKSGGPPNFGYPDPTYLSRLRGELAAKGIK